MSENATPNSAPSVRAKFRVDKLGCANAEAAKLFELGREYYVDFTPAVKAE